MRTPKYLSHSALKKFEDNREEYYLSYIIDERPPKIPQTQPMSVGSAFDAFVKSYMYKEIFGKVDEKFGFQKLFESQVEPQNRDWAIKAGAHVFACYKKSGACADLLLEMGRSTEEPVFELRLEATLDKDGHVVPVLGYPDLRYTTRTGMWVIRDWKVNGYCGKSATSPKKGFVIIRDGWDPALGASRGAGRPHKQAVLEVIDGIRLNTAINLHQINPTWGDQLCMYGWMLGCEIGERFVTGIEQCVAKPNGTDYPELRFARFQSLADEKEQHNLWNRLVHCWISASTGYIFNGIAGSREESDQRCKELDEFYAKSEDPNEAWLQDMSRDRSYYG
jgi:hypothetical protein